MAEKIRLDKFISSQMNISRSDAKEYLKKGRVKVNRVVIRNADEKLDAENDVVSCDGADITYKKYVYIMLNKPQGVICATKDEVSETVLELIPKELRRKGLFPAGRLDKDTEGFVFITDDGDTAHRMLSPACHVSKRYFARLEKPAEKEYIQAFADGLIIDGGEKCLPARLEIGENPQEIYITICEGKYHQIKRMFEKMGNKVVYLRRESIGGIEIDGNLPLGQCREITTEEIERLFK